ncbi:hypothetical protein [Nocardia altamirensis]|uniref:hypothetical protein n=1 Tax=Nocardia altamirensis TaxID=472158 RepID=UPI0008405014|nr:hypothetical protein [Nocardia altamirensis]
MSAIIETCIREAYAAIGTRTVRLAELRLRVPASPAAVDTALRAMARQPGVHLRAEADQKTLTYSDQIAAIVLGGTARHTLLIEP